MQFPEEKKRGWIYLYKEEGEIKMAESPPPPTNTLQRI